MTGHGLMLACAAAVLFLPLANFSVLIFFNRRLPAKGAWIATAVLWLAFVLSALLLAVKLSGHGEETVQFTFRWIDFGPGAARIDLGVMLDNLSCVMLAVVTLISAIVHLFSTGYMAGDVRFGRYFAFLGLFSFAMLLIVLTNNFFTMVVGWELVGLSSYLLIGHWYEKKSASDAAKKAFLVNRIGDLGMLAAVMLLFGSFHTLAFEPIFAAVKSGRLPLGSEAWLTAAGVLIFCAAVGKSAQFPLHVWLPDAMEGPTPVSALIHAATMVAAGVYLVARTFPLFTANALLVVAYTGAFTAFLAATIAVAQDDIKKVLAYSTISQLGTMIMGLGVGAYTAGFFHLVTHAMFKAGLFLGAGSVIHALAHAMHRRGESGIDPQDIRNMGGLRRKMPVTFWTFVVFTLAISGVPLTSGFLSKDEILAGAMAFGSSTGHVLIPAAGFLVAGLTAFYMFRLLIRVFLGKPRDAGRQEHVHESPAAMAVPLVVLAVLSCFACFSLHPFSAARGWIFHAIERPLTAVPSQVSAAGPEAFEAALHHVHGTAMALSLLCAGLGILAAFLTYFWKRIDSGAVAKHLSPVHRFLVHKWYFDELYHRTVVAGALGFARFLAWVDNALIDGLVNGSARWTRSVSSGSGTFDHAVVDGLVHLTARITGGIGRLARALQTGKVQTYLAFVLAGVLLVFFLFRSL